MVMQNLCCERGKCKPAPEIVPPLGVARISGARVIVIIIIGV